MGDEVIEVAARPTLRVSGGGVFPVRRVYCIGRNYAEHAIEMGHDPDKEPPFFFQKNPECIDGSGEFPYPPKSAEVHFEIELMVALGGGGRDVPAAAALDCVFGYGVALDMTRRDLQAKAKAAGRPWEIGKAFERAAPAGVLRPVAEVGHPAAGRIALTINGALRQEGDLNQMIWKTPEIIAHLSEYFDIAAGDVILTGTPAGVGAVACGDALRGEIAGLGALDVRVV